jgi:hypothetical protein
LYFTSPLQTVLLDKQEIEDGELLFLGEVWLINGENAGIKIPPICSY